MSEFKAKDAKGNLLKVGDTVRCIEKCYTKIYDKTYRILDIMRFINCIKINDVDNYTSSDYLYPFQVFIKIDCLKIKIRKLKKLINKN